MKIANFCAACDSQLPRTSLYDYVQCLACNTYIYISDKSADEENRAYFDILFKTIESREDDSKKLKIFTNHVQKDKKLRKRQYADYYAKKENIDRHLSDKKTVLEIGFGSGEHLFSLLYLGIDAYGIDLSSTAVENFQKKYPKYANRVQCATRFTKKVDIVYCCALFEHLDQPEQFIQDASDCLDRNGLLIIDGLPIGNEQMSDVTIDEDISFWKPCHRIIYSRKGLDILFARYGFETEICAVHDDYYYRILSMHIKYDYRKIIELRDSCLKHKELPSFLMYYYLCRKALGIHSLAYHGTVMFKKKAD